MRISGFAFLINSALAKGGKWAKGVNVLAPFVAMLFLTLWPMEANANPEGELFKNDIWSGPYIGVHGGYAWQDGSVLYDNEGHRGHRLADPQLNSPLDFNSDIVGVHGGYRVQAGQFIVGVEGDYSRLSEGSDDSANATHPEYKHPELIHAETEYLASLRATLGYTVGNVLVFGTAGIGFTEFKLSEGEPTDTSANPLRSASVDAQGLVYGGGVEFKLTEAVSLGALYLHYDVGKSYAFERSSIVIYSAPDPAHSDLLRFDDIDVVRVNLNIQLNSVLTSSFPADGYETGLKGAAAPTTVNWSGFYIGGHGGYGWSGSNDDLVPSIGNYGQKYPIDVMPVGAPEGWMGGGHIGAQQQVGQWVFGIEGTYDTMDLVASVTAPPVIVTCGYRDSEGSCLDTRKTASSETEIDNLWTLTGRIGYAWGRWLGYVKGGYARAEVSIATTGLKVNDGGVWKVSDGGGVWNSKQLDDDVEILQAITHAEDHHGWVIGTGADYMVSKNVIVGFDYSYIDLGAKTHRVSQAAIQVDSSGSDYWTESINVDPSSIHAVSARLPFLFGAHERPIEPLK